MTVATPQLYKQGNVVVLNSGKYAGKKAMVVTNYNDGQKNKKFGHCLVFGIGRYPRKITKKMSDSKIERRLKIKPFVKYVNFNHLIFTRYTVKFDKNLQNLESQFKNQGKVQDDNKMARDPL